MFSIGDRVVYGQIGVCTILDIAVPDFLKQGEARKYYILEPENQKGNIYTPVDAKVFMRPLLTKDEAEQLIDLIPSIQAEAYHSTSLQELTTHYAAALHSHDCADLIELIMSIYAKKQYRQKNNQKIGAVDEGFMKRAEELLYSELSIALEMPRDSLPTYIAARVKHGDSLCPKNGEPEKS